MQAVLQRIESALAMAQRASGSVRLLAVSKTRPAQDIADAYSSGQRAFGESQVQEALPKLAALANHAIEWHFIGPLQSNKTRPIAEHFAWVHSVDRERIAQRLSEQRPPGAPPLMVCVQVNVSGEASKHGVNPASAQRLARKVAELPALRLRGLMAIPAPTEDRERQRAQFRVLKRLYDELRAAGLALDTLSMGMSDDLEAAILEGATLVRIGSAIFGHRPAPSPSRLDTSCR